MGMTTGQRDRACGALLGIAAGDALGAGQETRREPGRWTGNTAMAVAVAEVAARGADLRDPAAQEAIMMRAHEAVAAVDGRTSLAVGIGALAQMAPVALAFLDDEAALVAAAGALSRAFGVDPESAEACVLWCLAIRRAVLTGEIDVRRGLGLLPPDRRGVWERRLLAAERSTPAELGGNGQVAEALQGAWFAIATTAAPGSRPADHLRVALEAAVRDGQSTVGAVAGALLGAAYGASAVPADWRRVLHGWPGMTSRELIALAAAIERRGAPDGFDYTYRRWPAVDRLARHPYDEHVWLAGIGALRNLPTDVTGVVSLCRVGSADVPRNVAWVEVRLIDSADPADNPHLPFVLEDAVRAVETMRADGRTVLIHCVQAHSRTPTVAALYGMRLRGVGADEALAAVADVLPGAHPNRLFRETLRSFEEIVADRAPSSVPSAPPRCETAVIALAVVARMNATHPLDARRRQVDLTRVSRQPDHHVTDGVTPTWGHLPRRTL